MGQDKAGWFCIVAQCEYLLFGAGRRTCLDMALGMVTLEHCVASLLQAFKWFVLDPSNTEATIMGVSQALSLCITIPRDC